MSQLDQTKYFSCDELIDVSYVNYIVGNDLRQTVVCIHSSKHLEFCAMPCCRHVWHSVTNLQRFLSLRIMKFNDMMWKKMLYFCICYSRKCHVLTKLIFLTKLLANETKIKGENAFPNLPKCGIWAMEGWSVTVQSSCHPVDYSMPGISVLCYLTEFPQIHVHCLLMLSNYPILCHPFILLTSIFGISLFSVSLLFTAGEQILSSTSASVLQRIFRFDFL